MRALASAVSIVTAFAASFSSSLRLPPPLIPEWSPASITKRGKRKLRRHGAKLKVNRARISKRTRRKHRRAA